MKEAIGEVKELEVKEATEAAKEAIGEVTEAIGEVKL